MKSEDRRDFFAGLAMQGILDDPNRMLMLSSQRERCEMAAYAYSMADAMIAERKRGETLAEVNRNPIKCNDPEIEYILNLKAEDQERQDKKLAEVFGKVDTGKREGDVT